MMLDWLAAPREDRGVHLAGDTRLAAGDEDWQFRSYADLAASARRVGAAMREDGVRPGDVVCVIAPTGFPVLEAIFGAWAAGATLCPVTPAVFGDAGEYVTHLAGILAQARPVLTVSPPELAPLADQALAAAGLTGSAWQIRHGGGDLGDLSDLSDTITPDPIALLQFTSGSSGRPRGVRVTWRNLEEHLERAYTWLGWREGDAGASWLPLHHDMGLIGSLLTTASVQSDLWLMRPDQFIRDPLRWVRCLTVASHTAAPSFAYGYTARRVPPEAVAGLDLSGLRSAVVGAEPVDAGALEAFARLAAPAGFSPSAYVASYGLAEATLGVCADTDPAPPLLVLPDPATLQPGSRVRVLRRRCLLGADPDGTDRDGGDRPGDSRPDGLLPEDSGGWLVACGRPRDIALRIAGEDGATLPEGHLGEITVAGATVAAGYLGTRPDEPSAFRDGELRTGDAGFTHEGQLFVLGRISDSMKVRGRSVYFDDLQARVTAAAGLPPGRCVVIGSSGAVALVVERAEGSWTASARRTLRAELGDGVEISIVTGGPGLIRRTSSGKPRRRHMWQLFRAGALR